MSDTPTREQVQEALDDATALLASDTYTMGLAIRHATKVLVRAARLWLEGPQITDEMIERGIKGARDAAFWADEEVVDGDATMNDWWAYIVGAALRAALENPNGTP